MTAHVADLKGECDGPCAMFDLKERCHLWINGVCHGERRRGKRPYKSDEVDSTSYQDQLNNWTQVGLCQVGPLQDNWVHLGQTNVGFPSKFKGILPGSSLQVIRTLIEARADVNEASEEYDWRGCGHTGTAFDLAMPYVTQNSAFLEPRNDPHRCPFLGSFCGAWCTPH